MQEPFQSDDAFLKDVALRRVQSGLAIWWLGQSGFLLMYEGYCALLDPYLSESLTEKYAKTDKPHVRMTRRVIDPRRLDFISVTACTHNHTDHLDAQTLKPLLDANPQMSLIVPEANRAFAADRLGLEIEAIVGAEERHAIEVAGFSFRPVPAAHETLERDAAGRLTHVGYIVRAGSLTIYHSGDTMRYPGMAELLLPFKIDVALLPINGRAPERRVAGNLNGIEAAQLAHDIGAKLVIPCHYDMFEFNTASPQAFVSECERLGQRYQVLKNGQCLDIPED
ncbi:MAG TPA: MBL fold metallo-hydrolase [Tepidisphaeraceae bacterium]|nr:MBL fold metallo-hydrolase [Tepidisphaeraceae bacterium]